MKEFIHWLLQEKDTHTVITAADAHFKFVSIHPFIDGNGRTSRLLMNLVLIVHGYPITIIRNEERTEYLNSLQVAQKTGNIQDFYNLVARAVERSLDIYIQAAKGRRPKLLTEEETNKEKLLKIGELAKAMQETNATIRHWTNEGLIEVAGYTKGGYQLYRLDMIERAKEIRKLQREENLSLDEIKERVSIKIPT